MTYYEYQVVMTPHPNLKLSKKNLGPPKNEIVGYLFIGLKWFLDIFLKS
jgi:hypothetical protein